MLECKFVKRITRKKLKSDQFAEEVSTIWDWTAEHKSEVIRYGAIGLAVFSFGESFDWPSEVYRMDLDANKSTRVFREILDPNRTR